MYNGIGLQTPRGSGTNGYVQRNLSYIKSGRDRIEIVDDDAQIKLEKLLAKKGNKEILEHEKKRQIEIQCLQFEEELLQQGYEDGEVEERVMSHRKELMDKLMDPGQTGGTHCLVASLKAVSGAATAKGVPGAAATLRQYVNETHAMAEATVAKNEAFRSAMKLKNPAGADEAEEDSQNGGGTAQNHEVVPLRPEEGSDDAKSDDDVGSPARHSTHKKKSSRHSRKRAKGGGSEEKREQQESGKSSKKRKKHRHRSRSTEAKQEVKEEEKEEKEASDIEREQLRRHHRNRDERRKSEDSIKEEPRDEEWNMKNEHTQERQGRDRSRSNKKSKKSGKKSKRRRRSHSSRSPHSTQLSPHSSRKPRDQHSMTSHSKAANSSRDRRHRSDSSGSSSSNLSDSVDRKKTSTCKTKNSSPTKLSKSSHNDLTDHKNSSHSRYYNSSRRKHRHRANTTESRVNNKTAEVSSGSVNNQACLPHVLVCGVVIYGEDYTKVPPPSPSQYSCAIAEWTEDFFWSEHFSRRRAKKLRKQRKKEKKKKRSESPAPSQNLTEEKKSPASIRVEVNHVEGSAKKEQEVSSQELAERPVVHVENKELGESNCSKVKTTASPLSKARRSSPHFLERRRITSARKKPIPYPREFGAAESSDSDSDFN